MVNSFRTARFVLIFQLLLALGVPLALADSPSAPGRSEDFRDLVIPIGGTSPSFAPGDPCPKDPSPWLLLGVGAAIAPLAYELGVIWHEGSHAAWAAGFGAHVTGYYPYPQFLPGNGFVFGYTTWTGQLTDAQTAMTYVAPKITDVAILTAYTITNETGNLPQNKWAQLAIDAIAVAAVVDLGHDVFQTNPYGDVPEFYRNAHITNTIPGRLFQGGLTLGFAAEVGHGIYKLFTPTPTGTPKAAFKVGDVEMNPYIGTETLGLTGKF